jgi:hypothetical protein
MFESDATESVCTVQCDDHDDCAAVGDDLVCSPYSRQCEPRCTGDLECGVWDLSSPGFAGHTWNYRSCLVATGECDY